MLLIFAQLALLFLTAWGWGFWLWKVSRVGPSDGWNRHGWFFFGLGGFMLCVLFLHGLLYLNLPLKFTAWAGLLIAAAGAAASVWTWRRHRHADGPRRDWREAAAAGLLFVAVFGFQGTPLFRAGPDSYYGSAHTDQVNYVLLSQFLVEEPLSTTINDIGLRPWLAKGIALKEVRKGQSVANGYLAVASLSDSKRAYGTLSIFMVAVGALSVFVLARGLAVPRAFAWLVGFWWGVLPAVTKLQLDGFFSQACVLFVFPALAAVFRVRRGRLEFTPLLLSVIYLAYLLCTYTEVYVVGLGQLFCLLIFAVPTRTSWLARGAAAGGVTVGSLLLTGPFLRDFARYITNQYQIAAVPYALAELTPQSGTWLGWKQIFVGYATLPDARLERLSVLAGFAVLFFIVCAFQRGGAAKRRFLLALIAPPLGVLTLLFSAPELPKYAFSKLVDTFTPFWLVLAALGALSLRAMVGGGRIVERLLAWAVVAALALVALGGSWPQWRETWEDRGILADVDSDGARRCYTRAQRDPGSIYLIAEANNLLCAWLAYAARHSQVYVSAEKITDLPLPASIYTFRRQPPASPDLVVLSEKGPVAVKDRGGMPVLVVQNPQGIEGGAERTYYWVGPEATVTLSDYSLPEGQTRRFILGFEAIAGPASPAPERSVVLVSPDGSEQKVDFANSTTGHFLLDAHAGDNVYKLRVYPAQPTVILPSDQRDLMVRIQQLTLTPAVNPDKGRP